MPPVPLFDDLLQRVGKTAKGRLSVRPSDLSRAAQRALAEPRGEVLFDLVKDGLRFADLLARQGAEPHVIAAVHTHLLDPMIKRLRGLATSDQAKRRPRATTSGWAAKR